MLTSHYPKSFQTHHDTLDQPSNLLGLNVQSQSKKRPKICFHFLVGYLLLWALEKHVGYRQTVYSIRNCVLSVLT